MARHTCKTIVDNLPTLHELKLNLDGWDLAVAWARPNPDETTAPSVILITDGLFAQRRGGDVEEDVRQLEEEG